MLTIVVVNKYQFAALFVITCYLCGIRSSQTGVFDEIDKYLLGEMQSFEYYECIVKMKHLFTIPSWYTFYFASVLILPVITLVYILISPETSLLLCATISKEVVTANESDIFFYFFFIFIFLGVEIVLILIFILLVSLYFCLLYIFLYKFKVVNLVHVRILNELLWLLDDSCLNKLLLLFIIIIGDLSFEDEIHENKHKYSKPLKFFQATNNSWISQNS